jgi:hypothetical protein
MRDLSGDSRAYVVESWSAYFSIPYVHASIHMGVIAENFGKHSSFKVQT